MRVVLLASGSGSLAQSIIDARDSGKLNIEILQLISDKQSQAIERASAAGISTTYFPMLEDRSIWDTQLFETVKKLNPDLVVSVGFMRILAAPFVSKFPTINTHPALLPKFPGAHAIRDALNAGAQVTGSTVHWVDAGIDTGTVIAQKEVVVLPQDDEASLHERIKIVERELIVETLQSFIAHGLPRRTNES
jgi:phosphoribosylglycinamide formyltransferase-1